MVFRVLLECISRRKHSFGHSVQLLSWSANEGTDGSCAGGGGCGRASDKPRACAHKARQVLPPSAAA